MGSHQARRIRPAVEDPCRGHRLQDWQEVRAEYVSNLKSENVQEDEEDEKEPDETVNLAKELFGEKVVEIND